MYAVAHASSKRAKADTAKRKALERRVSRPDDMVKYTCDSESNEYSFRVLPLVVVHFY